MRIAIVTALAILSISLLIDGYIYFLLRRRYKSHPAYSKIQLFSAIVIYCIALTALLLPWREEGNSVLLTAMWMLYIFLSTMIGKAVFTGVDLLASVPELFKRGRLRWLTRVGAVAGILCFIIMWWGALVNRFNIQVKEVKVTVENLPPSFDGIKMAQISDLHLGTFGDNTSFVTKLIARLDSLQPDIIVFTGDIVNRRSDEMLPFLDELSKLKAPMGVYAILGNHDYGDYSNWPSDEAKEANMQELYGYYDQIGWKLLRNETAWIKQGADSIALIGVENIGDPPFHSYGDLERAYPEINDKHIKILLSHNPAHWVSDIRDDAEKNIALTLSGHTHAMQIEAFGISPAALRYQTWGGLYESSDSKRPLYVNIGDGAVGFPARIGATPEITIITLSR